MGEASTTLVALGPNVHTFTWDLVLKCIFFKKFQFDQLVKLGGNIDTMSWHFCHTFGRLFGISGSHYY